MATESDTPHRTQTIEEGYGAPYHRIYSIELNVPLEKARRAMSEMMADPNECSPQFLAKFEKIKGSSGELKKSDEFYIHLPGPWDAPVKVLKVSDSEFRFATLEGHLEAGEITFRVKSKGLGRVVFEIESLARSRDGLVDFVYDKIPLVRMAQTEMWTQFCEQFAEKACGPKAAESSDQKAGPVHILTERFDEESGQWKII